MRLYRSCLSKRGYQIKLILNANNKLVTEIVNDKKRNEIVYIKTYAFLSKREAISKYSERIEHLYSWGYDTVNDKTS